MEEIDRAQLRLNELDQKIYIAIRDHWFETTGIPARQADVLRHALRTCDIGKRVVEEEEE
jgi:hypothetical protein